MPIKFAAKKVGWSQSDKGFVLRLLVAPDDDWTEAANAPLGSPFGVVMVPIDPETGVRTDTSPGSSAFSAACNTGQQRDEPRKSRQPFHQMSRAQQAGILANDATFQLWFSNVYKAANPEDDCAEAIRQYMGLDSRADIDRYEMKSAKWDRLVAEFREQTGRLAEMRG